MNVINLKNTLKTIIEDHGYTLWFGSKTSYNRKKKITNREVIIEPFILRLEPKSDCEYDVDLVFWVGLRRDISAKFTTSEGDDTEFMQFMLDEANAIFDSLSASDKLLIKIKKKDVNLRYYEADSNQTVNTQSFIRFSLPIRCYGI